MYFGGDVQDLEVNMNKHRDNKNYSHWSLEKTALLLTKVLLYINRLIISALLKFLGFSSKFHCCGKTFTDGKRNI